MPSWRTIRYDKDHRDEAGLWHRAGDQDRVVKELAIELVRTGTASYTIDYLFDPDADTEIPAPNLAESTATSCGTSDNLVMATTTAAIENPALKTFVPSPQQLAVFDWVENGTGHAIVIAVAGAGKTTTLIECFKRILRTGKRVVFLAFNNKIAREIRDKVQAFFSEEERKRVEIKTFHAYGMKLWFKANPDCKLEGDDDPKNAGYSKFDRIVSELETGIVYDMAPNAGAQVTVRTPQGMAPLTPLGQMPYMYKSFVRKAWTFARQNLFGLEINLLDKQAWLNLVEHFDLEDEIAEVAEEDGVMLSATELQEHVYQAINWTVRVLRHGISIAHEVVDFEDVIYMPLVSQIWVWQNDWVLVDEAQDSNPSRRAFVTKIVKATGRTIWVGDPAQAIYGFTGADSKSLDTIRQRFGAQILNLTVTYRCPKSVVAKAKQWVSHIEAHETAPEGSADRVINVAELPNENLEDHDAILCRNNKPLAQLALALIRKGIPCHVEGKDLGEALVKLVVRWKSVRTVDQLVRRLEEYRDREVQKAMTKGREHRAELVADSVETLLAIIADMPRGVTLAEVEGRINSMFLDSDKCKRQTLTLSSIHKAKGREWNRVFWYGPATFQPSKYAHKDWQVEQEKNLMYVAATRSKQQLVTVTVSQDPHGKIVFAGPKSPAAEAPAPEQDSTLKSTCDQL